MSVFKFAAFCCNSLHKHVRADTLYTRLTSLQMADGSVLKPQAYCGCSSCWCCCGWCFRPLGWNSMRAPGEVPGLSCSRGKAISPTGAAWLPVNNVTHKLIMLVSLLTPLLLPAASRLTPMTVASPIRSVSRLLSICGYLVPIQRLLEWRRRGAPRFFIFYLYLFIYLFLSCACEEAGRNRSENSQVRDGQKCSEMIREKT